jgi:hypothetical protein
MNRTLLTLALVAALVGGPIGECLAQNARFSSLRGGAAGGPLARLNKPLVPTLPGLPTASPLGLIAPRLSNAMLIFQKGGVGTQAGRLAAIGVLSPRVSPLVALVRTPPKTPQGLAMYGLTILSPRAAVLIGMLRGARGLAAAVR